MTGPIVAEGERQPGFGTATLYDQHPLRVTGEPATRPPAGAVDVLIVVGLVLVGTGLPAAAALWAHSFNIPRNDDWAYRRILFEFVHTGHYSLVGWGAMSLVGQILWAAPFVLVLGAHAWVPGLAVAVTAAIGLVSAYVVARSVLGRSSAAAVVLTVLALPGFLVNTSTFMSDVPAFAADAACLGLGLVAAARPADKRWPWVLASVAVGVVGFSIRQFDLAAPLSVLVVLAATDRRRLTRYCIIAGCTLAACGAIYAWTATLAHAQLKHLGLPTASTWQALGVCYFTLSFFVAPWLPGAVRRSWAGRRWSRWRGALAGVAALAIGVLLVAYRPPLLLGNYLSQSGVMGGQVLFGDRPELFARPIWWLIELVALGSGATLAFVMAGNGVTGRTRGTGGWQRRPPPSRTGPRGAPSTAQAKALVTTFTLLNVAVLVGYGIFVQAALWDRYLWPVAFGAATLLAAQRPGPANHFGRPSGGHARTWVWRTAPVALALMLTVVTAALTLNSDAYDAARWSAGRDAVKAGFAAGTVDAGFEWVGSHATAIPRPDRRLAAAPPYDTWYDQMFPGFKECAFVSGSRLDEAPLVLMRTIHYQELAFAEPEVLYLYAVRTRACTS